MRFASWWQGLERRLSRRNNPLVLGHRNLYILPSRYGSLWLLTSGLLYLIGINTRSNGPLLLAFLMGALMLLALFLTHFNLQGLKLAAPEQALGFAGEPFRFQIQASSAVERPGLMWRWLSPSSAPQQRLNLSAKDHLLQLYWPTPERGRHLPGRLLLHTTAPLGLFRCWTYWEPQQPIWIAPARISGPVAELTAAESTPQGNDEFSDLKPWRPGEGPQRVDWKALARGRGWLSKQFTQPDPSELWLGVQSQLPRELALAHLCHRLCQELNQGRLVGLQLPNGDTIEASSGPEQLQRCLIALAELPA
jgi:uncharacterized protein (DUF58 family)